MRVDQLKGVLSNFFSPRTLRTIWIIVAFYLCGAIGIGIPSTQPFFVKLIPSVLLLSFISILFFHNFSNPRNTVIALFSIFFAGFLIEVVGVNTHLVFGDYSYGDGLGYKLWDTPILIGINWVLVTYCSASVMDLTKCRPSFKVIGAALLMVLSDFVLEHIAPLLKMWNWKENTVPLQNYVAWFMLALVFNAFLRWLKIPTSNPIAVAIFICQFLFFVLLLILLN